MSTAEIERRLIELKDGLSLSTNDVARTDGWERLIAAAENHIKRLIRELPTSQTSVASAVVQIKETAERVSIMKARLKYLLIEAWTTAVENSLDHGVLTEESQRRLADLKDGLSLSREDLARTGGWERLVKSAVIRDLVNGVTPKHINLEGDFPFNFQKSEEVVWIFKDCDYLEEKTFRQYVGRSRGLSVRIVKGVYYRVGDFRGTPIDRTELVKVDTGLVAVTTKHIYFAGAKRTFRIPYAKIVAFERFSDGLGVVRDAASAKPQIFVTDDGWFTYNVVTNLAHR
jgi:hypothetical protein